jgi:hypothetical protein
MFCVTVYEFFLWILFDQLSLIDTLSNYFDDMEKCYQAASPIHGFSIQ